MARVFVTSDTHFGDEKIWRYEQRPFETVAQMDEALIERWNAVVAPEDLVFHLGDVSFHDDAATAAIIGRLHGDKHLVLGNHDVRDVRHWMDMGFAAVYRYPVFYHGCILRHDPPHYYNPQIPYFFVFGHVHGTPLYPTLTRQAACACVERWDYAPVLLEELRCRAEDC